MNSGKYLTNIIFLKAFLVVAILLTLSSLPGIIPPRQAAAYSFSEQSGIKQTAQEAGYDSGSNFTGLAYITASVGKVVQFILSMVGVLFLILLIYGGFIWMKARGSEAEAEKAKKIITDALIGLIIVLSAYAIAMFVGVIFESN